MPTRRALKIIPLLILFLTVLLASCSDSTDPVVNQSTGTGQIDPSAGSFVLKSVDTTDPEGRSVQLELVGSDLKLDDDGQHVELTVAVRNNMRFAVRAPLILWLVSIDPSSVFVANADTSLPVGSVIPVDGFVYYTEFGRDLSLAPGEISVGKVWRFKTPDQGSFSFGIRADMVPTPERAVIAGVCFWDDNRNGVREENEAPLLPGLVHVTTANGTKAVVEIDREGGYEYELREAGLYQVLFVPLFETFAPLAYSAPNPRQVLITPGPDGSLVGIRDVNFGAYTDLLLGPPPIMFTDTPLDSLQREQWYFLEADMAESGKLSLSVGYSGCQPRHHFSLWTDGAFMESFPIQVNLTLVHETEEACDAYWEGAYPFNLETLRERFLAAYGPGQLTLNLIDFEGERQKIEWEIEGD